MRPRALAGLLRPSMVGAVYMLGVSLWTAKRAAADERLMGVSAADVTRAIVTTFADHVQGSLGLIACLSVLIGLALGATAGLLVRARARLGGARAPEGLGALLPLAWMLPALHLAALSYGIARRPQLYVDALYARGGVRRLFQIVVTDVLGPWGAIGAMALATFAYLLLPPRETTRRWGMVRWYARRWRAQAALLAAAALVALGLARPARLPPRADVGQRPNVLVLAADSLRADRLDARAAPHLAELAKRGASFSRAYTSLPRTFPAWVTRLSGLFPHHHGIRNMFPSREARGRDLDALPRRLGDAGYATSVASDYAGDVFPRADFGFARVDTPTFHFGELVRQRALEAQTGLWPWLGTSPGRALVPSVRGMSRAPDADDVTRRSLAAIDAAGERPFFHVAFYSTAHFPYAAPWPGYRRFSSRAYRGRFKYEKANLLGRDAPPDDDDVQQIRALYDGAVSVIDDAAGDLLAGLDARGLTGSTVIVITADHGETLFEGARGHGHGDHLFGSEALQVPLAIVDGRAPGGREVRGLARDVDLAPTLYELTGVAPPATLDGRSLVPALRSGETGIDEAFAETGLWFTEDAVPADQRIPYPDVSRMLEVRRDAGDDVVLQDRWLPLTTMAKHRALITATHQLVLLPTRAGLRTMLFDLATDPHAVTDLSAREPELTQRLRTRLLGWTLEDHDLALDGDHLVWRGRRERSAQAGVRLEGP